MGRLPYATAGPGRDPIVAYTSGEITSILISLIIAAVIARRSYAVTQGVPWSTPRLYAVPVLIFALWAITELESLLLTPWAIPYLVAIDVAILVATTLAITGFAERETQVYRDAEGGWQYRIGFSLAGLFLGAYVVRLILAITLFPESLSFGSPPGGYPPTSDQVVLAIIDAMFSMSAGLLLGRSRGAYRRYLAERAKMDPARAV